MGERSRRRFESLIVTASITELTCPTLNGVSADRVVLAHGEGGRLMRQLIERQILPTFDNRFLRTESDAAVLPAIQGPVAVTTDSFVVSPIFFPGGDIGKLAVFGTVNDLAVAGARPRWITLSLILEEGLEMSTLRYVLASVAAAAKQVGVLVVTGDTKVVPKGAADQLFINTTGIGEFIAPPPAGPSGLEVGDELIVSGPVGRHGMAVMSAREGIELEPAPISDCAPLIDAVAALQKAKIPIRALRDATRGGLAAVLHEWADASDKTLVYDEDRLPVLPEVRGACELLGLDPVHVANEGTMVVAVPKEEARRAIEVLRTVQETAASALFGWVEGRGIAAVAVERATGQRVPLDEPLGAPLPRIC
jgi:hydrogenase expression/formation protein HypE